jgi:hypothetical protein
MSDMAKADNSGGSGPYKANYAVAPGLSDHTLYAPKTPPPADVKMPVIVWGNGACSNSGSGFYKFLNEIASHGYYVVANGPPSGGRGQSTAKDLPNAIEWVTKNAGKGQFVNMDGSKIAAAGQSCGGIQAYSASLDHRVKATGIFNSGLIVDKNSVLFQNLTAPVGYFLGGPSDIAYENVSTIDCLLASSLLTDFKGERDYTRLPAHIPAIKANLDVGHGGTYFSTQGGKFGKAAVYFFDWQLKGDKAAGQQFLDPASSSLTKDGWKIESRNQPK